MDETLRVLSGDVVTSSPMLSSSPRASELLHMFHESEIKKRIAMDQKIINLQIENLELEVAVIRLEKRARDAVKNNDESASRRRDVVDNA